MKTLYLAIFMALAVLPLSAQSKLQNGLKVNGLGLDAKYADVIKKFGKPTRETTTAKINECIGSRLRTMHYPGLVFELVEGDRNAFTVYAFTVTSAKWDVSGDHVGDTAAKIQRLYGTRGRTVDKQRSGEQWYYEMSEDNPGGVTFLIKGGKVTEISCTYEMC
jgi:hypothetical protein